MLKTHVIVYTLEENSIWHNSVCFVVSAPFSYSNNALHIFFKKQNQFIKVKAYSRRKTITETKNKWHLRGLRYTLHKIDFLLETSKNH